MPKRLLTLARILNHRQARKHSQEHGALSRWRKAGLAITAFLCVGIAISGIVLAFSYASVASDMPSLEMLPLLLDRETGQLLQPTRFLDRGAQVALAVLQPEGIQRRFLPIDPAEGEAISPFLVAAVINTLQPDFWQSPGYDSTAMTDPTPRTIAERLVSDLLLWQEQASERKAWRMRILARQVTLEYGRDKVLEWYLNSADFGHGAFGAEAAAQLYLQKPASALTLGEAAFLTALLRAPALNPFDAQMEPLELMQPVLEELAQAGVIQAQDVQNALAAPLLLNDNAAQTDPHLPAVARVILQQLAGTFGSDRLRRGGLNIITTIDADLQTQTTCAVQAQLARMRLKSYTPDLPEGQTCTAAQYLPVYIGLKDPLPEDLAASAVVLDPLTGEVLALVGDTTLQGTEGTLQRHAPGSLLSPFVAVAGFARGLSPATLTWDVPSRLPESISHRALQNEEYQGPIRLRTAIQSDALNPLAQLLEQSGADNVWSSAQAFGLSGLLQAENPLDLLYEGAEQSPLQLALAYAVFDNGGIQTGWRARDDDPLTPVTVKAITDPNNSLVWDGMTASSRVVVSAPIAYLVQSVLEDTTSAALPLNSRTLDIAYPIAVKAGTLADGASTWMLGYTRQRLALVWLGSAEAQGSLDADMPGGIWRAVMRIAQADLEPQGWSMPAGVSTSRVCDPSGLLPTTLCPTIVEEVFLDGEEPYTLDNLYQSVEINRDTGLLATVFTPLAQIETRTVLDFPEDARGWAASAGWVIAPQQYDLVRRQPLDESMRILSPDMFAVVGGEVPIFGTVAVEDMKSYHLEAGAGMNPSSWIIVAQGDDKPVTDALLGTWDTTGLDGLYALRLIVQTNDLKVKFAVIQVSLDNTAPELEVLEPFNDKEYKAKEEVLFSVSASDNLEVARVEWWLDGIKVGTRQYTPYAILWTAEQGSHELFARVFDLAGNMAQSETQIVQVVQ